MMWLSPNVTFHGSRANSFGNLSIADLKLVNSKFHCWATADWDYGETTVIFCCVGIGLMILSHIFLLLRTHSNRKTKGTKPVGILDKLVAIGRYSVARQYYVPLFHWYSPPMGAILALVAFAIFLLAMTFAATPYYWPSMDYGYSPPIATRSGWLSLGIMPFLLATASKINWIGLVTGTSHEKLQVFHRWTAVFMWITSLVHTFPFIWISLNRYHDQGDWYSTAMYWTGFAALGPQTYLVGLSWGIFRNPYYEIFKKLHMIAAVIFMVALFIHVGFMLTSWDYFVATGAVYLSAWLIRVVRTHYRSGMGVPATIILLAPNTIQVSIQVPKKLTWSPGQHVFVRFLGFGIAFFSSHPFTVASVSDPMGESGPTSDYHSLDLVMRIKGGITSRLAKAVDGKVGKTTRVLVDGPYGGIPLSVRDFDTVYLIAGGSGAAFTITILLDLVNGLNQGMTCTRVEFILAIRTLEDLVWMDDNLTVARGALGERLRIHVYITDELARGSADEKSDHSNKSASEHKSEPDSDAFERSNGRPKLPDLILDACNSESGRMAFVACGPESMLYDVRNATAECQRRIIAGSRVCKEIFLHTENYGQVHLSS